MRYVATYIFIVVTWLAGVALAKGAWSTFFSIILPPYAWYLVVEKALLVIGWIQ